MTGLRTNPRLKDWYISENLMLDVARAFVSGKFPHSAASDHNLPEGVKVVGVWHDYYHRSFVVRLAHDSFDPVPDGQRVPRIAGVTAFRESPRDDADVPSVVGR